MTTRGDLGAQGGATSSSAPSTENSRPVSFAAARHTINQACAPSIRAQRQAALCAKPSAQVPEHDAANADQSQQYNNKLLSEFVEF